MGEPGPARSHPSDCVSSAGGSCIRGAIGSRPSRRRLAFPPWCVQADLTRPSARRPGRPRRTTPRSIAFPAVSNSRIPLPLFAVPPLPLSPSPYALPEMADGATEHAFEEADHRSAVEQALQWLVPGDQFGSVAAELDRSPGERNRVHRRSARLEHAAGGEPLHENAPHGQHILAREEARKVEVAVVGQARAQRVRLVDRLRSSQLAERVRATLQLVSEDRDRRARRRIHLTKPNGVAGRRSPRATGAGRRAIDCFAPPLCSRRG